MHLDGYTDKNSDFGYRGIMEKEFTLSAHGMSENDELVLQSLINIIDLRSNAHWSYAPGESANVLIIDVDSTEGRQFWDRLDTLDQNKIAIAYGVNQQGLSGYTRYALDKPLRSKKVLDLLEKVSQQKLKSIGLNDSSVSEEPATGHRRQFIQKIRELFESGSWGVRYKDQMLIINGEDYEAYTAQGLEQLYGLAEAPELALEIHELTKSDTQSARVRLKTFKYDEVLWHFSRHSRSLVSQLAGNKEFKIRRWPNLKKIRYQKDDVRVFGMLMKNWMSMDSLNASTDTGSLPGLLNALYMTGFLQTRNTESSSYRKTVSEVKKNKGLYSRIRNRLGIT